MIPDHLNSLIGRYFKEKRRKKGLRRERLRLVMLFLLIALSSAIVLWSPLFGQGATDTEPPTAPTDLQYTSPPTDLTPSFASTASTDNASVAGTYAPTIGQFQAPSTVYANKYFYLNATINDADGVTDFVNATININGTIVLKWDNATGKFSEQSDSNNYCTLDASGSVKTSINSTAYKLSWKIKLYWNYTEGSIFVLSTNTKVYDSAGNSGSGAETSLFTFEDDLIIHTDATVDDSHVNPSDTVTFTASIYYEGTTSAPEDVTGITAYVELNGVQKGSDTDVTGGLSISVTAESNVTQYSYNIYCTTDQNSVANQTVNLIVDRQKIILKGANDTRDNVGDTVRVYFNVTREYDNALFDGTKGKVYINGTAATWDGTNKYWYLDVSQSSVGAWVYQVSSITDTEYGITALNDVAGVQQVIWDRVKVYYFQVNDTRVDTNSYVNVTAEALLEYDDHPLGSGDSLSFNSTSFVWNGNLFTNNTLTKSTVGNWTLIIDAANEATYGITAYTTNITNPWVVWDKVQVMLSISDNRINVGDTADITKSAVYEYDSTSFTGTIDLNDTKTKSTVGKYGYKASSISDPTYGLTVFATNEIYCIFDRVNINSFTVADNRINVGDSASFTVAGIYEYDSGTWSGTYSLNDTVSKSVVGKYGYKVSSITDSNYGLTVFQQTAPDLYVIFDKVTITLSISDNRINVGSSADISASGTYQYDSTTWSGTFTLNDTTTKSVVGKYTYTTSTITDNNYGITVFDSNSLYCIFDKVTITLSITDDRIDVGTSADISASGIYQYDNAVWSGTYTLNDTTTKSSVGKWWFTVSSITDSNYGITSFDSNSVSCIWDRVEITLSVPDIRINVGTSASISKSAIYEYDGTTFVGTINLNDTETKSVVGNYTYTTSSINDTNYGLTVFTSNIVWCVFDRVKVESSGRLDGRVDIGASDTVYFLVKYEYDLTLVSDGSVLINGTASTYSATNQRWELSVTQSSVGKWSYYVSSVSGNAHGITVINHVASYPEVIWDRFEFTSITVDDNRINVGGTFELRYKIRYDYDDVTFDSAKGSITGFTWDSVNSWWKKTVTGSSSVTSTNYDETYISITDTTYGLTVKQDVSGVNVITDRLKIINGGVVDSRIDCGTAGTVWFNATWEYDSVLFQGGNGTVYVNGTACTWSSSNVRWEVSFTYSTVANHTFKVSSITDNIYEISELNDAAGAKWIIWDRIKITDGGVSDSRCDYGSTQTVWFKAEYEYDSVTFDSGKGTLYVNGTSMSWSVVNGRWEKTYSYSVVIEYDFKVSSVSDGTYGLTVINDIAGAKSIIWDRVVVTISADSTNPNAGQTVNFTVTAVYDYDDVSVTSWTVNIYRNGTHFATGDFTDRSDSEVKYQYTTENVTDNMYNLTAFTSNTVTVVWGNLFIEINEINVQDGRIDIGTQATVYYHCRFSSNQSSCTTGTLYVNGTSFTINSTGWATVTFTFSEVCKKALVVTAINVNGETDFQQIPSNPEIIWDRIVAYWEQVNDTRTDINSYVEWRIRAVLDYDNHPLGSGDSLSCSWGSLSWDSGNSWFEITHTEASVTSVTISLSGGSETTYGITAFIENITETTVIFDRVNVTISADGTHVVLNTQVNFTVTAIYEFDSNPVTSWTVNIYRNSTHFATGNFTDTQASPSVYEYTTENITEGTYGLTAFQSNTVIVEWYNSPPVASFTYSPEFPIAGETATFNASTSYDLDGTITIYKWDFGDGTAIETSPTPTITHIYKTRGNYTVTLTVIDDEGSENKTEATITIIDYPTADFNYLPTYPLAGETATFNASTSAPNGGTIVSYFWDFGDGTTANVTSAIITHTYLSFGNYTVTLTVKDSEGLTNSCSKVIRIIDYPTADFTYSPTYPITGEAVTFNASTSTPNGGTIISYFWDFGDGTNATGLIVSHIYPALGSYLVTLKISDSEGLFDNASKLIDVRHRPTANFTYSPTLPMIGETVTFNGSSSKPNGGSIVTYAWDFGDAQTGIGVVVNHTYLTYGTYNVTLTVTDSEGLSSSLTQTIRILIWPAANFTYSPKYPVINQTVEFDGSLSHDPDGAIFEYTWDFGDGNVTTVQNPLIEHAYQETDTYLVTLTVKDSDGLSNSITKQVIVYSVLPPPDIAVLNVETAYSQVYQGYTLIIKVTVFNEGYSTETFNVTVYANNNIIETLTVSNLPPDEQMILTFRWDTNGFAEYQNYTISAYAHPVPREIDIADNSFVGGVVRLVHIGDVNNDGQVRVDDILFIALAFGSNVGDSRYDPALDITCDGKIRIDDILAAVLNFGWTKP